MSKTQEALKLALEVSEEFIADYQSEDGMNSMKHYAKKHHAVLTAIREALADQPAQQQEPEPDRVKFERHWRKTRGDKKANRELPRHPLQPQTYIQDSANRHWVTWQAAVRSVAPPASKPWVGLTNQELIDLTAIYSGAPLYCAIEAKLREKNT